MSKVNKLSKAQIKARRTYSFNDLSPHKQKRRLKFIEGIMLGMTQKSAALYAGISVENAQRLGNKFYHEPAVQSKMREIKKELQLEDIIDKKDIILGLAAEARNSEKGSSQIGRITALTKLHKFLGYEDDKGPEGVKGTKGVILIPMASTVDEWEQLAKEQQERLTKDSQDDDND